MNRSSLLLAFAVAASAGAARAQVQFDSSGTGAFSIRGLIAAQSAPSTPAAASAAPAAAPNSDSCPDGAALKGREMQVTLDFGGVNKPLVVDFAYDHCQVESPRDEPPVPDYTYRQYKSAKGDVLGVYSSSDRPTSNVSLHLADGRSSASLLPILATRDLASGATLDLGEILLVKATNERDGVVTRAAGSIKSVPSR
jgi:hypothetical protein